MATKLFAIKGLSQLQQLVDEGNPAYVRVAQIYAMELGAINDNLSAKDAMKWVVDAYEEVQASWLGRVEFFEELNACVQEAEDELNDAPATALPTIAQLIVQLTALAELVGDLTPIGLNVNGKAVAVDFAYGPQIEIRTVRDNGTVCMADSSERDAHGAEIHEGGSDYAVLFPVSAEG